MKPVSLSLEIQLRSEVCSSVLLAIEPDNGTSVIAECLDERRIIFQVDDLKVSSIYSVVTEIVKSVEEAENFLSD
ncbi:MAG: hypothetical protein M1605_01825 [Candidatus Thermoplasmatota archaeon]|nr:hypothetical protein [Candidatus Thermoplasmatota archaeon]